MAIPPELMAKRNDSSFKKLCFKRKLPPESFLFNLFLLGSIREIGGESVYRTLRKQLPSPNCLFKCRAYQLALTNNPRRLELGGGGGGQIEPP